MSMPRILFVDDDALVLGGLRDMLWRDRSRWELAFAIGADAALEQLKKQPVSIVVSDMRMPGLDGAALLAQVKALYPTVARLVLSGHAERDAFLRAMPVAHQFLAKPCDAQTLRTALERTLQFADALQNEALRGIIGSLDRLPSVPKMYVELTAIAQDPTKGLSDLATVVERDPAMSATVLQVVNSAYFGVPQRVTSIQRAVSCLGAETLKALAFSAELFSTCALPASCGVRVDELHANSLRLAQVARQLLPDPKRACEAFTAALMVDIGRLVLAMSAPEQFKLANDISRTSCRAIDEVEHEVLGVNHAEVGAYLLGMWGLPQSLVETVAHHHRPSRQRNGPFDVLAAVHVASALTQPPSAPSNFIDLPFLEATGYAASLPQWQGLVTGTSPPPPTHLLRT